MPRVGDGTEGGAEAATERFSTFSNQVVGADGDAENVKTTLVGEGDGYVMRERGADNQGLGMRVASCAYHMVTRRRHVKSPRKRGREHAAAYISFELLGSRGRPYISLLELIRQGAWIGRWRGMCSRKRALEALPCGVPKRG